MMNPDIVLDDTYGVLTSGSVIQYNRDTPITVFVTEDDGTKIGVRFEFVKEQNAGNKEAASFEATIHPSMHDENTIKLAINMHKVLSNFGMLNAMKVGNFNGKELLFNFRMSINGDGDPAIVHFTWFIRLN